MGDASTALRAVIDTARVLDDADLSAYTTMRVGGPAATLVRPDTVDELRAVAEVIATTGCPWMVIGRGSNLLIADAGWPGIAVVLGRGFRGVHVDGTVVHAGAAEPMPAVARVVARHGLGGLAFGVAIPGTVGGAVRMNAGAHGGELRDVLVWAEVARMGAGGAPERWPARRLGFSYRHSDLAPDAIVTRIEVALTHTDADELAAQMAEMRQWRRDSQPINQPSCGSVFRNPDGDSAGRLIEEAGCKGLRVGGAQVSQRHANFITVTPDARAADVHEIIRTVGRRVHDATGISLRTEVVLAGFDDASRRAAGEESAEVWT
ncbi:UDP-N-acetylmuramate dehydrogenase [soil metagenome]